MFLLSFPLTPRTAHRPSASRPERKGLTLIFLFANVSLRRRCRHREPARQSPPKGTGSRCTHAKLRHSVSGERAAAKYPRAGLRLQTAPNQFLAEGLRSFGSPNQRIISGLRQNRRMGTPPCAAATPPTPSLPSEGALGDCRSYVCKSLFVCYLPKACEASFRSTAAVSVAYGKIGEGVPPWAQLPSLRSRAQRLRSVLDLARL